MRVCVCDKNTWLIACVPLCACPCVPALCAAYCVCPNENSLSVVYKRVSHPPRKRPHYNICNLSWSYPRTHTYIPTHDYVLSVSWGSRHRNTSTVSFSNSIESKQMFSLVIRRLNERRAAWRRVAKACGLDGRSLLFALCNHHARPLCDCGCTTLRVNSVFGFFYHVFDRCRVWLYHYHLLSRW